MTRIAALAVLVSLVVSGFAVSVPANSVTFPLATPSGAPIDLTGAAPISLVIRNNAPRADRLIAAHSTAAVHVEIHSTRLVDGRRIMQPAAEGIALPAGNTQILEPGANHLMLVGLRHNLVQGATFSLTLCFERAGNVTVTGRVRRRVDAAGITPIPAVVIGDLTVSLVSAPPAPAGTPASSPHP